MSGISTRDGKTMTLAVKGSQVTSTATQAGAGGPHTCYVFQVFDGILNLRRGAVDSSE